MARQKKISSAKKKGGSKKSAQVNGATEHPTVAIARGLAQIIEEHSLSELIMDTPEITLTLRRSNGVAMQPLVSPMQPAVMAPQVTAVPPAGPPAQAPAAEPPAVQPEEEYHVVTSPFVGTFYRRPNPDSDPYVTIGARVTKGQTLCIVEAMKLMNEIEADVAGTVADILVDDATSVEYDQPLFKIVSA